MHLDSLNSVMTATPGPGSSITSTNTVSTTGGAWRLDRPRFFPRNLLRPISFGVSLFLALALATVALPRADVEGLRTYRASSTFLTVPSLTSSVEL